MQEDGLTRLAVPVGPDDHIRGNPDAPVTLVEYGDFECPYCGVAYPAVKALEKKYGDRLRVVFRSFPLQQHRHAQAAAEAAEFAADGGKFWEMHDTLYEHQRALEEHHLLGYAKDLGLDPAALATALREQTYRAHRRGSPRRRRRGRRSPARPAFFLNDVLFEEEPTAEAFLARDRLAARTRQCQLTHRGSTSRACGVPMLTSSSRRIVPRVRTTRRGRSRLSMRRASTAGSPVASVVRASR